MRGDCGGAGVGGRAALTHSVLCSTSNLGGWQCRRVVMVPGKRGGLVRARTHATTRVFLDSLVPAK